MIETRNKFEFIILKTTFFLYHISFENFPIGKKNSLKVKVIDKFLRIFFFQIYYYFNFPFTGNSFIW